MTQPATERSQNIIIKNLQSIFVALCIAGVTGLFTWGTTLSRTIETQREEYVKALTLLDSRLNSMQKEMNDAESDINDLQKVVEETRDDLKTRIVMLEDYNNNNNCKIKK